MENGLIDETKGETSTPDKSADETPSPTKSEAKTDPGKSADETQNQEPVKGEVGIEIRIGQLRSSINGAKCAFKSASNKLLNQIVIWCIVIVIIIAGAIQYGVYLHEHSILKDTWTWQVIYYTVLRITILGVLISFGTYCMKLLSSHIKMYQNLEHKRAILESLPGFVESGIDPTKRDIIFNKLIEMVVQHEEPLKDKDIEMQTNSTIEKLVDLLSKFDKKDK